MNNNKMIAVTVVLVLTLSVIASKASFTVPTNGIIGYWPADGTATDASPVGNNGSFGGSYAPGPTGMAFNLGSAKVTIPNNPAYNFKSYNGWSVGFWFNGNGATINNINGLFLGQDNASGYNPKWFIDYGYTVFVGNNGWYNFHVNDYNQERIFVSSQSEPSPIGWNQLTVTIDNTNNGTVNFYLNGQSIGTAALGNYVLETTAPLVFGAAEGFSYNGLLSDVVIYDRVLSTNEVLQLATRPPLTITNQPASVSVSTGGTATFSVGVTGSSPFSCQWALNGTNISGATNAFLTLTNVSSAKVGVYTVTVTNSFGDIVTSVGATLTTVDIRMFAGIIIIGVIGTNYTIQSSSRLPATNWTTLTNIALPSVPYVYIDYASITNPTHYYRAFATP